MAALRIIAVLNVVMGIITIAFGEYYILCHHHDEEFMSLSLSVSSRRRSIEGHSALRRFLRKLIHHSESFKTTGHCCSGILFPLPPTTTLLPRNTEQEVKCRYPVDGLINLT